MKVVLTIIHKKYTYNFFNFFIVLVLKKYPTNYISNFQAS